MTLSTTISTLELAKARETANKILAELELDAFLFGVEPRDGTWELTFECACYEDGGWERVVIQVPKQMLLDSFDDETAKQQLFDYWKKKFADCKVRQV